MFRERLARVRAAMASQGVDVLLLSVGADLPWLCGYEAMPLERLTMLVVPRDDDATLVVPALEAPRVEPRPELFSLRSWSETEDPVALVTGATAAPEVAAIGDQTWARVVLALQARWPGTRFVPASTVTAPLRAAKDDHEVAALAAAAAAADRVAAQLRRGEVPLRGRTEAEVSADLSRRLLAEGHQRVNFAIVAAGPNAASPHHEPGATVLEGEQLVLCDFGGTRHDAHGVGYCSDITRCVWLGERVPPDVAAAYAVLQEAQAAAVAAAQVGITCAEVDGAARRIIAAAGHGPHFVHRTGHGIGVEAHEDPYIVEGNVAPLEAGHAFSVEPGIYLPGRWGMRLEDIVVATEAGPRSLNTVGHDLVAVEA